MANDHLQPKSILQAYWGYDQFRPLQEDIIHSILQGRDTLALLPTGGGKSICFQVPALAQEGICLVISPLIALMKDQVENLHKRDIPALCLFSGMTYKEIHATLNQALNGHAKFLYCSPERLQSSLFLEYLPGLPLSFIAIDEAHCISQWGYDFRPSYLQIAELREHKPDVPFLALTASATPTVRTDIMKQLKFRDGQVFTASFARSNLIYRVQEADSRIHAMLDLIRRSEGSAIVYCKSRKRTQEMATLLQQEKISASYYHAGLSQEIRNERQTAWITGDIRVIVCTNAFGMGIDKPDVRMVIHLDCPDSPEHYYQEAGRAGRDGQPANAILLKDQKTAAELSAMPDIRYPSMDTIRKVYQALGDYLQIAAGTGESKYWDFDLESFISRFSLGAQDAIYSLQALEQEGIIQLTEQLFRPARVCFTTNRETLEMIERTVPQTEPLIKALLRNYGGIWDQPTAISEKQLAFKTRNTPQEVINLLNYLQNQGVLQYQPKRENPQVIFLQNRIKTADLHINQKRYNLRKKNFTERINAMIHYLNNTHECRSVVLCRYFGDLTSPCGICDKCRSSSIKSIQRDNLSVRNLILETISRGPIDIPALILLHAPIEKEQIALAVQDLLDEGRIKYLTGTLYLTKL